MTNPFFSCLLAATIVVQSAAPETPLPLNEQSNHVRLITESGATVALTANPGRRKPGKTRKYKKKMSKQMKKRKHH